VATLSMVLFAVSLLLSWLNSATHVLHAEKLVYNRWITLLGERPGNRRWIVLGLLTLVYLGLLLAFCVDVGRQPAGWLMLGLMMLIRGWEIRQWNREVVVGLGKYVPAGASLLGFLVGSLLVGWLRPEWNADAAGWDAAAGVLAACWGLAAFAKLRESGLRWTSAANVAVLVRERSYMAPRPIARLRRAVSKLPWLCMAAAYVGFWGEAAGMLFIFPVLRWPVAIASALFQLGITILLGYWELEWIVIMLAVAGLSAGAVV
jgi:hypothetical protein